MAIHTMIVDQAAFSDGERFRELTGEELDAVSGGLVVEGWTIQWLDGATNWGSVVSWGLGGAVAGSMGGWEGAAAGAVGGAGADYLSQHLNIYAP